MARGGSAAAVLCPPSMPRVEIIVSDPILSGVDSKELTEPMLSGKGDVCRVTCPNRGRAQHTSLAMDGTRHDHVR